MALLEQKEFYILAILLGFLVLLLIVLWLKNWHLKARLDALYEGIEQEKAAAWQQIEAENTEWRQNETARIRKEAISRSKNVVRGKIYEQLVPFADGFPFNPQDARFLGSPIDYIIFDGLDDGELREVVLAEVKSGNAKLSAREAMIREAVQEGRVRFIEMRVRDD